jgi:hypothetical protein
MTTRKPTLAEKIKAYWIATRIIAAVLYGAWKARRKK